MNFDGDDDFAGWVDEDDEVLLLLLLLLIFFFFFLFSFSPLISISFLIIGRRRRRRCSYGTINSFYGWFSSSERSRGVREDVGQVGGRRKGRV